MEQSGYVHLVQQCCLVAPPPCAMAALHIILAIFAAAGLTKLSPAV